MKFKARWAELTPPLTSHLKVVPCRWRATEVLAALCEILACSPSDLVEVHASTRQRKAAQGANVVDMATTVRPRRARVTRHSE